MSDTFIYKGKECIRMLVCFSDKTTSQVIDKNAPIFGVGSTSFESEFRQLNSEIRGDMIRDLVKFWGTSPEVKFRFLVISFQNFIGKEESRFNNDALFRSSVINLFMALFQQILIEVSERIRRRESLVSILRVSQIANSGDLIKALKKFDAPYQKSLISQDAMGFVGKNISESSATEYKGLIEALIELLTIKIR